MPLPDGRTLALGERTLVMGILNVTPDSFSDGGALRGVQAAVEAAARMVDAGADIIDVGGESTRPGATPVSESRGAAPRGPGRGSAGRRIQLPISIDTYKAPVAEAAANGGRAIVNDISGLRYDPRLAEVVASLKLPIIVMHMRASYHRLILATLARARSGMAAESPAAPAMTRNCRLAETAREKRGESKGSILPTVWPLLAAHTMRAIHTTSSSGNCPLGMVGVERFDSTFWRSDASAPSPSPRRSWS